MDENGGLEKYMWQLLGAIAALSGAVVFMFKAILAGKDQHLQSLVAQHGVQITELVAQHSAQATEHRATIIRLETKLEQCEKKHADSEKETRDLWWTIAKKFDSTPAKLKEAANDSDQIL